MTVLGPPLDKVSRVARPYPGYLLRGCETGLALFAAAYLGHNDAIYFARNDMHGTCVDVDASRLDEMGRLYPEDWEFVHADAWTFANEAADQGRTWDAVSVDTFTGDATDRSLSTLELWCCIAKRLVTSTIPVNHPFETPGGWRSSWFPRSNKASWLVLQRD